MADRVHDPARCTPADAGLNMLPGLPEADAAALNAYFRPFAAPVVTENGDVRHLYCLCCGEEMNRFGHGVAMMWELTHGEARCSGCGWPARGMHYVKRADGTEVCTIRHVFLQYHPNEVSIQQPSTDEAS